MPPSPQLPGKQSFHKAPFLTSIDDLSSEINTNIEIGLTEVKVKERQHCYGPNKLSSENGAVWYTVLLKQISNAMILVLVLAMALAYGITDYIEGGVITVVIVLNVLIGFYQEFDAEKKMDSLRSLSSPSAAVLRDGRLATVPSAEVIPGDIIQIKIGDTIPADLRLFEAMNLECDEKILTGEAIPVAKDAKAEFAPAGGELAIGVGDRVNMAHSSSSVTKGRGKGVVVFTGMYTEIGKIASSMQGKTRRPSRSMSRKKHGSLQPVKGGFLRAWDGMGKFLGLTVGTPLQRKLSRLAYLLFGCAILLAIIVFGVNRFQVTNEVAIYAISTGIAIIPESLIAVLTITMVVGMTQMRKKRVVIRQLSALEALGGVTNICSDKTGTLTQGRMITRKAWIPGIGTYIVDDAEDASDPTSGSLSGPMAELDEKEAIEGQTTLPKPDDRRKNIDVELKSTPDEIPENVQKNPSHIVKTPGDMKQNHSDVTPELKAFLESTALCNLASVRRDNRNGWQAIGDPTEIALQVFAHRLDFGKKVLEASGWEQLAEHPFDSTVKRMSTVYRNSTGQSIFVFTKGAVEQVIELSSFLGTGKNQVVMTAESKQRVLQKMTSLADQGLRVMAVARREVIAESYLDIEGSRDAAETELTLLGLAGLYDPPRLETRNSVRECAEAGIKVHMLTGDHAATATAIAKEVGILPEDIKVLSAKLSSSLVTTAREFDGMSDDYIDQLPTLPLVIARCAPNTKTRMIAALHRRGAFAAMTGDGVNDAPSLQAADIGIAMGLAGSDIAKGASDIVLTDDNFASIVNAIEEGRRMFDNIQKFVLHLLCGNVAEVILLIVGLAFQDESGSSVFPLSPLQILWINMLTSSFPAFGLGREKASSDIMQRPPHNHKRGVFTLEIVIDMIVYGTIMGTCTLLTFVVIIYGAANGDLGVDCNRQYSQSCDSVFRARAAVFAELTWLILISAWEFKSIRRSMFSLDPALSGHSKTPFFKDIYDNRFLFYAVVIGAVTVFPAIYIPGLNTNVFKQTAITWEWGLSLGAVIVFVLGVETWKILKRIHGWFGAAKAFHTDETEVPQGQVGVRKGSSGEKFVSP